MLEPCSHLDVDVLVLGGGLAGLMAAVSAREAGAGKVLVLDKCEAGKSGASVGAKKLAAVGAWSFPSDSPERHCEDTLRSGCGLNDVALVEAMTSDAEETITALEGMGMLFDEKNPAAYASPDKSYVGHGRYRLLQCQDSTGKVLLDVLRREAYRRGVEFLNDSLVLELVVDDDAVRGAIALHIPSGAVVGFRALSTVLATGGAGHLYARTSNPPQLVGAGLALAYEAGAELMDLEMVQFYPVNYVFPQALEGKNAGSYAEARITNARGERFMEHYDPERMENTTRDRLAQAISLEIRAGRGTAHGGVFIDRTGLGEAYYAQFPVEIQTCQDGGLDLRTQRAEVSPASHYTMGGVRVDARLATRVDGLFAAGEVAAGVHGANRLADNSLTETLVLGRRAGREAARDAARRRGLQTGGVEGHAAEQAGRLRGLIAQGRGSESPHRVLSSVRRVMWEDVGVVRSRAGLERALTRLADEATRIPEDLALAASSLQADVRLVQTLELTQALTACQLIAESALTRTESRGAHYREDFPSQDDAWGRNVVIRKAGAEPEVTVADPTGRSRT